jgi:hypothetical protein
MYALIRIGTQREVGVVDLLGVAQPELQAALIRRSVLLEQREEIL